MIACKHGRDENVKELLAMEDQNIDDMEDDHEEITKKPRVVIDVKNRHSKAAIHYAAKHGHLVGTGIVVDYVYLSAAGTVPLGDKQTLYTCFQHYILSVWRTSA